jgi:hypothetical protein
MDGADPGYVYWERPEDPWDSGWRVFVGDETQADADTPENFQINRLDALVGEHPRLAQLFTVGNSGFYEWDSTTASYRRLADE